MPKHEAGCSIDGTKEIFSDRKFRVVLVKCPWNMDFAFHCLETMFCACVGVRFADIQGLNG